MSIAQDRGAQRRGLSRGLSRRGAARARAATAGAVLALMTAAGTPAFAQDEPIVADVQRILVEGARRVDEGTVRAYMTVAVGEPATPAAINESVRRLFETGLFENVEITPLADGLLVQVREAPYINRIEFEGADKIEPEELQGVISSAPRNAFSRAQADADAQAIRELYRRTGRYGAQVEPKIIRRDNNRVDLVFEIEEGERTGVREISFVGNSRFSDGTLRGVVATKESGFLGWLYSADTYDPDKLEFDKELLRNYYLENGYADFRVLSATAELTPDREDFVIVFTVEEGEVYAFGEQKVETSLRDLDPELLQAQIIGAPGDDYDAGDVRKTVDALIYEAGRAGYAFIDVKQIPVKHEDSRTVDITYQIEEGPRVYVERINIEGNSRTQDRVLRREFDILEGDAYDTNAVQKARNRLRALGYFSDVKVDTVRGSADDRAVINVTVEEQLTGSISFGLGFSSSDGVLAEITVTEKNFLGRGQTVSASLNLSGTDQTAAFSFIEPRLLDRDLAAGFRIAYSKEDNTDESSYEETNIGFHPFVEFPIAEDQRLRLRYRISSDEIRDVSETASPAIIADEGTALTSSVGVSWTYDLRNDPVEPTSGFLFTSSADVAGLGGTPAYLRTQGSAKGWTSFFDDELVGSLELAAGGIVSPNESLRVTDRFRLGGDSFRGFDSGGVGPRDISVFNSAGERRDDALGGNYYAIARANLSFPLGLPDELGIYGGLFADAGTVWGLDQTTYVDNFAGGTVTVDDGLFLRASVGASLFIDSPFGPLRFNFAYPVVREEYDAREYFRFTAGTRF